MHWKFCLLVVVGWIGGSADISRAVAQLYRPGLAPQRVIVPRRYRDPYSSRYRPVSPPTTLIDSRSVPNPPLSPVTVTLGNDSGREIDVRVVDLQEPARSRSFRIPPGRGAAVNLIRDSGMRQIDRYRVIAPNGQWMTQQSITEVPPADRYEIVVHQWAVQSVAIDRTGKSPQAIEEIHFQGRGIGRFRLPPGPQLQTGKIDVVRAARRQGNQGTIQPIVPPDRPATDTASPLDRAILEAQQNAQSRRP